MTYTILNSATTFTFTAFVTNNAALVDPSLNIVYYVCSSNAGAALTTLESTFFVTNPVTSPAITV
jgi:hypothetical protein